MGQTFRIPVRGDLEAKLRYARQQAATRGVTMTGNTQAGRFSGVISGSYEISGDVAIVTITDKPFIVSWATIEEQLRGFLRN